MQITRAQLDKLEKAYAELTDASNGIVGRAMASGPSAFDAITRYTDAEFELGQVVEEFARSETEE